jgi:hypothetical protein
MVERLRRLLPPLWAGLLLGVGLVAAPAAFATLAQADAARVAARLFALESYASLAAALLFTMLERKCGGRAMGANVLLALAALFCTVAGQFALQPMMAAAKAGQGALTFGQLHALSVGLYGIKLAAVLALAWRVSSAARAS